MNLTCNPNTTPFLLWFHFVDPQLEYSSWYFWQTLRETFSANRSYLQCCNKLIIKIPEYTVTTYWLLSKIICQVLICLYSFCNFNSTIWYANYKIIWTAQSIWSPMKSCTAINHHLMVHCSELLLWKKHQFTFHKQLCLEAKCHTLWSVFRKGDFKSY